jgi:hypothetical protein
MAHFARIENNKVVQVIVVDNTVLENTEFPESEPLGQQFIDNIGLPGLWLQTSYNGKFRKNYAGVDYTYDKVRDAFISPRPYNSWKLKEETLMWEPPIPHPTDGSLYLWNEENCIWIKDTVRESVRTAALSDTPPDYDVE